MDIRAAEKRTFDGGEASPNQGPGPAEGKRRGNKQESQRFSASTPGGPRGDTARRATRERAHEGGTELERATLGRCTRRFSMGWAQSVPRRESSSIGRRQRLVSCQSRVDARVGVHRHARASFTHTISSSLSLSLHQPNRQMLISWLRSRTRFSCRADRQPRRRRRTVCPNKRQCSTSCAPCQDEIAGVSINGACKNTSPYPLACSQDRWCR
jgi:hypothetical protein